MKLCRQLEAEHNVRILFAIENGSRAWRMESKNSDYDIRFVFARPLEDYLTIHPKRDVIEFSCDEQGVAIAPEQAMLDFVGHDIFKFCQLLQRSNPTIIEWLVTDIIYYGQRPLALQGIATQQFNPKALYHHYRSCCHENYMKYIVSGNAVTHKKYLYAMRGLVNALWVARMGTVPPIRLEETVRKLKDLPSPVQRILSDIIALKKQGKEKDGIPRIPLLDTFIASFLQENETKLPVRKLNSHNLDDELRRIVLEN